MSLYIISTKKSEFLFGEHKDKVLLYQEEDIDFGRNAEKRVFGRTSYTSKKYFPATVRDNFEGWLKANGMPTIEEMKKKAAESLAPIVLATMPEGFRLQRQKCPKCWVMRESAWDAYKIRGRQQWLCVNKDKGIYEERDTPRMEAGWANQQLYSRILLLEPNEPDAPEYFVPDHNRQLNLSEEQKAIFFDIQSDVVENSFQNFISSLVAQ